MKARFLIVILLFILNKSFGQDTVIHVDLDKYAGKWYVIACIPTSVDKHWNYMTETYTIKKNGNVSIYTTYLKPNDHDKKKQLPKEKHLRSKGFPQKGSNNFKWKVQFFWPFKVDYLIEEVPADYSYTVVGHPEKKFLYFMSREKTMSDELYKQLALRYKEKGYDMSKMIRVPQ
ncbi:MAG: Lipocalin family protein [Bacteroidetes bacterium]|jgi:apolipoprotein D and lipocalin family protein|nr:Lipocalin family protein [Bacteroidota bacterium]